MGVSPSSHEEIGSAPLESVGDLDYSRYAGRWFEVARLPNRFQPVIGSSHTATVSYLPALDPTGMHVVSLDITNRDRNNDNGHVMETTGTARPSNPPRGEFAVKLYPSLSAPFVLPFEMRQWVVEFDEETYAWAVLSEPTRRHLWILSRELPMDAHTLAEILAHLRTLHGFADTALASLIFSAPPK